MIQIRTDICIIAYVPFYLLTNQVPVCPEEKKCSSSEQCSGKKKVSVIFYIKKYRNMFVDREGMGKVREIIFALWYCCGF